MPEFSWPSLEEVIFIHDATIARFGGSFGLRDAGLLESALARPFASFGGMDVFSDDLSRVCAMSYSIVANHPFVDGNKRTGIAVLGSVLRSNGIKFKPRHEDLYKTVMGVADGTIDLDQLIDWVRGQVE